MAKRKNPFSDSEVQDAVNGAISAKTLMDVVAKMDPLKGAQLALEKHLPQIEKYAIEVKQLDVTDEGSAALMTSKLTLVRQAIKILDEERKGIIAEPDKFVRTVNSMFKSGVDRLRQILGYGEPKLNQYADRLRLEQRIKEKKLQEELDRRQAEMNKAAKKAGVEPVQLPESVRIEEPTRVQSENGSVTYKTMWVGTIIDADQVPREYCLPDQKLIDRAIDAGIRTIPGVEIKEVSKPNWRTR